MDEFEIMMKNFWNELQEKIEEYTENRIVTGRKYLRTEFVKNAFGKHYPEKAYMYSKVLDDYTASMDDLYDDVKMSEEEIRINILLVHKTVMNLLFWPNIMRKIALEHFEKMIRIAFIQEFTNSMLNQTKNEENALKIAIKNYEGRAIDIDFAIKIPLCFMKLTKKEKMKIIEAGRIFRAFNLLIKDIKDLSLDEFHNTDTPVVIFRRKNFNIEKLKERMYDLSIARIQELKKNQSNEIIYNIIENFEKMIC